MLELYRGCMFEKIRFLAIIIFCGFYLNSCLTYGRPESIFVNFVGRNLKNFIEHDKTGEIPIQNMEYSIIYLKRTFVVMEPPIAVRKGTYLETHLVLRRLPDSSEEIFLFTKNHHLNPGSIERVIEDKANDILFFLVLESRENVYNLLVYDLANLQILDKILVLDKNRYQRKESYLSGSNISNIVFDVINRMILFQVNFNLDTLYYEGREYYSLNLNNNVIEEISEEQYIETLENLNIPESPFSYISNDNTLRFFSIVPFSDYLPANFKHKYNGIYINDGINNTRISRNVTHLRRNVIWLNDGRYVVNDSFIYDTSGRMNEVKLVDGEILTMF
jgi:hypothetical protein